MKNKLTEKLTRWLYGRYGTDELNMAILVLALVISLIAGIVGFPLLSDFNYCLSSSVFFFIATLWRNLKSRSV